MVSIPGDTVCFDPAGTGKGRRDTFTKGILYPALREGRELLPAPAVT